MRCASCEFLIERKFMNIAGIEKFKVDHTTGKAEIYYSKEPDLEELQKAIEE